jgi:hypothetical protein
MDQQSGAKVIDCFDKLFATALLVVIRQQTPLGTRVIKSEGYVLARKFCLLSLYFGISRSETKGTTWGVVRLLIATHFDYLCWIKMTDPDDSAMQSHSAQSPG